MRVFRHFGYPLAALLLFAPGCGRSSAEALGASAPVRTPEPHPRGVARAFTTAVPETILLSPSLASENPQPTVDYSTLEIARDSIEAIVHRATSPGPEIRVSRSLVHFKYWYVADSADGWAVHVVVADTSECPV